MVSRLPTFANDLKSDNIRVGDKLKLKADGKTYTSSRSRDNGAAEQTHKVKKGETLGQIATKYGVTVDDLRKWNNIKGNNIAAGQNLKVYSDKKVDRKTDKTDKTSKKKQKTHKVKRGETLGEIAEKYGVGLSKLKKANGIKGNNIQIGQSLKIPQ
jgi:LysM repeat protein